jgi:uncharacterized repeat protein (TIGR03847 family)
MDFPDPERFVTGTVGEPGQRTFFLQAVQGGRVASVALEKAQVAILADRLIAVVDELERRGLAATDAGIADDDRPLDEPLREEFRVGTLTIAWDDDLDRLVVEARSVEPDGDEEPVPDGDPFRPFLVREASAEAEEVDEEDEDDVPDDAPIGPDVLRVRISAAMAQGFAKRALRVVAAGRPACPFCGLPIEKTGHLCPRQNGSDYVH